MTAFDLKPAWHGNEITADGHLTARYDRIGNKWEINESSILTKLIQETGRFSERFASDLFIDWKIIDEYIQNGTTESTTWFFGIRECGVDHDTFINSRMANDRSIWRYEYRKIYRLDAIVTEDDYYGAKLTMKLYEVD